MDKEKLIELYVNQGLTMAGVAKKLHKGIATVHRYIKKYNIPKNQYSGRDENGHFLYTTGGGRYKAKQKNGRRILEHRLVWEEHNGEIPEGMMIHHIDENKKNNNIDNLQCITYKEHNNIHSHEPWNKGLTTKTNKKWKQAMEKRSLNRRLGITYK